MRIGVFIKNTTLHKSYGGFETQNKLLCEGLVTRGHEVYIFSPQKELNITDREENGVRYIFIPCIFRKFSILYSKNKNSWYNRSYDEFKKMHENSRFDVVISQSSWGLGVIRHKKELEIPVVSISHGSKIGEYQTRLQSARSLKDHIKLLIDLFHVMHNFFVTQRQFIHGADKAVAVSNAVKQQIMAETHVAEGKVEVIHNGVDPVVFATGGNKQQGFIEVLYVGRVIRDKGIFVLANAMKDVVKADPGVKVSVIGEGEDSAELERYIASRGLNEYMKLEGKIPYNEVTKRMSFADIFVLPSLRVEGFPMTIIEAMFAGLPVIAADMGGNADAIEDGATGFLVKSGNAAQLAEKIIELARSSELRQRMSQNAVSKAKNEFTLDIMLDKYEKVLQEVITK